MDLHELMKKSSSRHEHLCPRQVLGLRIGLAGLRTIGLEAPMPDKAALVIIETDGCFADGVEIATGATIGHRTLRMMDQGKIAAVFANVRTGKIVRLAPCLDVRQRALFYAPGIKRKYYAQLKGYQVMPEVELFTYQEIVLDPALGAILSRPGLRTKCANCREEIINERQVLLDGKAYCRTCAGESYYRMKDTPH